MKLYTKTGDTGETGIVGGRVRKSSEKVAAYGTVDEANSAIGLAITDLVEDEEELAEELIRIQHELFDCGGDLSLKSGMEAKIPYKVNEEMVAFLETRIDAYTEEAPALERFILPGGTKGAAQLHVARTVVRRAERYVTGLSEQETINPFVSKYLNRLSDYLFAASRVVNNRAGVADVEYERSGKVFRVKKEEDDSSTES